MWQPACWAPLKNSGLTDAYLVSTFAALDAANTKLTPPDLAKPKFQDTIALLSGCAELIAELQAAQTDFEQARIAYEAEKAKEGMVDKATTVKTEVLEILNDKIGIYLRAVEQVGPGRLWCFCQYMRPNDCRK